MMYDSCLFSFVCLFVFCFVLSSQYKYEAHAHTHLKTHSRLSQLNILFILKVANIRCVILIKCSEQEARFKKYVIMS